MRLKKINSEQTPDRGKVMSDTAKIILNQLKKNQKTKKQKQKNTDNLQNEFLL